MKGGTRMIKMTFILLNFSVLSINPTRQFLLVLETAGTLGLALNGGFPVPLCDIR